LNETIDLIVSVTIPVLGLTFASLVVYFTLKRVRKLAEKTRTRLDDFLVMALRFPLLFVVLALSFSIVLKYWQARFPTLLPDIVSLNVDSILAAASVLFVGSIFSISINWLIFKLSVGAVERDPDKETSFRLLQRVVTYSIYAVSIVAAVSILFPVTFGAVVSVIVGAGFLAIVVGLAAQKVIGNWLAGIMIQTTRPYRIGDAVLFRNEYGVVEDITLRHTVLRTWDNKRVIIPNSVMDEEPIVNYTIGDPRMLVIVTVSISYESDLERAKSIMAKAAKDNPNVLKDMAPVVQLLEFQDSGMLLRLLAMAKDQPTAFSTACELRETIKKAFDAAGIEIPYPHRTIVEKRASTGGRDLQQGGSQG
jgi:small-conductance mechanosensitive channel